KKKKHLIKIIKKIMKTKENKNDFETSLLKSVIEKQMKDMTEIELRYIYKQIINLKKVRK
ncbi:hypothetical protein M0Q97_11295, partial [Candidatus Dojkabacteria bacterium]|nr:hypothetical protein [Candidatus Dojkabacteria bacterium]